MKKPTIAICYDFDGTLSPGNMQEYGFFDGLTPSERRTFWTESKKLARDNQADNILMYMKLMLDKAKEDKRLRTTRKAFKAYGKSIELYEGVESWFDRISNYGSERNMNIKHFIVSSGLQEMIEGTRISKYFERVFACSFFYDNNDAAIWPAQVVNFTTKTQCLFRINKGVRDITDDRLINQYVAPEKRPIPFSRMIYIGDGETDIPCMKLVKEQGGYSIAVFDPSKTGKKKVSKRLKDEGRVNFSIPAEYSCGSKLEETIFRIIDKMASEYALTMVANGHKHSLKNKEANDAKQESKTLDVGNIQTEKTVTKDEVDQ